MINYFITTPSSSCDCNHVLYSSTVTENTCKRSCRFMVRQNRDTKFFLPPSNPLFPVSILIIYLLLSMLLFITHSSCLLSWCQERAGTATVTRLEPYMVSNFDTTWHNNAWHGEGRDNKKTKLIESKRNWLSVRKETSSEIMADANNTVPAIWQKDPTYTQKPVIRYLHLTTLWATWIQFISLLCIYKIHAHTSLKFPPWFAIWSPYTRFRIIIQGVLKLFFQINNSKQL
jgi:hypothetical protein